jgi:hypothetical protein
MLLLPSPQYVKTKHKWQKKSKIVPVNAMKAYGGASGMNPKYWLHTAKLVKHNSWLTVLKTWLSKNPQVINMGKVLMAYKIYQIKESYNLHAHFFIWTVVMQVQRNSDWLSTLEWFQIHVILCTTTFISSDITSISGLYYTLSFQFYESVQFWSLRVLFPYYPPSFKCCFNMSIILTQIQKLLWLAYNLIMI